jgi:hypothetical protein
MTRSFALMLDEEVIWCRAAGSRTPWMVGASVEALIVCLWNRRYMGPKHC